jgi:DNA-binding MarR family transcriptional regulator
VKPDTAAALFVQLGRLVRLLRQESEATPVGPGGMSAMVTLSRHPGGLRLGELAEEEGVRAPSLTRIVNGLEDIGLVARTPDPRDGRAQLVELTAAGRELITTGQHSRVAALRRRIDALDAADRRRLDDALPALEALLSVPAQEATGSNQHGLV